MYCIIYPFHLKENPIDYFEVPDTNKNQPRIKCERDIETDFHKRGKKKDNVRNHSFTTGIAKDFVKTMAETATQGVRAHFKIQGKCPTCSKRASYLSNKG